MSIYPTKSYSITKGPSEFDILAASHKFLREDNRHDGDPNSGEGEPTTASGSKTWEDRLAEKYYENLYREFAVCDLKHYKSGNFALRWRIEEEVISGAGETTCGNTRCKYHLSSSSSSGKRRKEPRLTTLELPFAYIEHGEPKSALVKVVLCPRCVKKLMWKKTKEKEMKESGDSMLEKGEQGASGAEDGSEDEEEDVGETRNKGKEVREPDEDKIEKEVKRPSDEEHKSRRHEPRERHSRRRNSRSRSPRHTHSRNRDRSYDHRNSSYHK